MLSDITAVSTKRKLTLTRTRNDRYTAISHLIHEENKAAEHIKSLFNKVKKIEEVFPLQPH